MYEFTKITERNYNYWDKLDYVHILIIKYVFDQKIFYHNIVRGGNREKKAIDMRIKKILFGNNVSHAHNKTRRKFKSNSHVYTICLPEGGVLKVKCPASMLWAFNRLI